MTSASSSRVMRVTSLLEGLRARRPLVFLDESHLRLTKVTRQLLQGCPPPMGHSGLHCSSYINAHTHTQKIVHAGVLSDAAEDRLTSAVTTRLYLRVNRVVGFTHSPFSTCSTEVEQVEIALAISTLLVNNKEGLAQSHTPVTGQPALPR